MKLLVVEDDERIWQFLFRGLSAEGYSLTWEANGRAGLETARREQFDAIILDLMLPGMDGREICRRLRAEGVSTKILMLTALETTADLVKGLRMGADDYLSKPFAFDELTARLEVLTRGLPATRQPPHILSAGLLQLDTAAVQSEFDGVPVALTSLEHGLLELLMEERGKVVTRARILKRVWGTDQDPLTNVIDVYVRRLRSKLKSAGAPDMITTVRGRGYRLD
ncbi:Response regulator [Hoeflea phototrophica DFL-43]|uniref:Cell cycle response regulator CtrA n=1 Tax=Hoeflea phototrophica (strain DSM 17068 / NCIMB 14078 / DFL-43) TaxID=411684 RepID=A9CYX4_HOEPD|nr:response regulator transcription factor [Hoeflea phototrophica]EDQ34662.1 Response regulator [Hoeflea phototrophica DFL-43]